MKLVVASDFHPDWHTIGVPRFDEIREAVRVTVQTAIREKVDVYLFTGDLCNPDAGSVVFRCVQLVIEAALELRAAGIDSHWLAGNHDVIEDGSGDTSLAPMCALEKLNATRKGTPEVPVILVHQHPDSLRRKGVQYISLPFTATSHAYDPAEHVRVNYRDDCLNVVMGHLTIPGVQPGEETTDMPRGRDVVFPLEELADKENVLMVNGHYHRQQVYKNIHIPGSLARLTFTEEQHHPGYLIIEV